MATNFSCHSFKTVTGEWDEEAHPLVKKIRHQFNGAFENMRAQISLHWIAVKELSLSYQTFGI